MTAEVRFSFATTNDLSVLLPLVEAFHQHEGVQISASLRHAAIEGLLSNTLHGRIILAYKGNELSGYSALCYGYAIEFGGREAFVDELFIVPEHRGQGIGEALLDRALETMQTDGIKAVHLEVGRLNAKAQALYQKRGFLLRSDYHLMSTLLS